MNQQKRSLCLLISIGAALIVASTVIATGAGAIGPTVFGPQIGKRQAQVDVVESNGDRLVLDVDVPDYVLAQQVEGGIEYDAISIPDWGLTTQAGWPQLPMRRLLLGIPPEAEVQLKVLSGTVEEMAGSLDIIPAPELVLLTDPPDMSKPQLSEPQFEKHFVRSPEGYGIDVFYPGYVARLGEVGFLRNQRVVAVEFYPIQYNPVSQQIRAYSQVRLELSFLYPQGNPVFLSSTGESPEFQQLLQGEIVNYDSARLWQTAPREAAGKPSRSPASELWPLPAEAFKIFVLEDGLYQLTHAKLAAAGVPVNTLDPRTIQMFANGQELAIRVVGGQDGAFGVDDFVLFYGQGIEHKYTDKNVYWLTYNQALGRRMAERASQGTGVAPEATAFTVHRVVDENRQYTSLWPGEDSFERWYWHFISSEIDAPQSVTVTMSLGKVSTTAMSCTLTVHLWGYTDMAVYPDHHAVFSVNGHRVGEDWWDGNADSVWLSVDFPQSYLTDGVNTFIVDFPGDTEARIDQVVFDRLEVAYGHAYRAYDNLLPFSAEASGTWEFAVGGFTGPNVEVYDTSSPVSVTRIVSLTIESEASTYVARFTDTAPAMASYVAVTPDRWLTPTQIVADSPSSLHDVANGADYVVISPSDFMAAAQSLAVYRAGQGLRTKVVDLEDVYDEFAYGLSVPEAIRDFLRYTFEHWQPPAPTYVVLMGDGHYDPKYHLTKYDLATEATNFVPPYLAFVDPWLGETATDNYYAAVVGDDIWPDLVLGRFPATTPADAMEMVSKTIKYERFGGGQQWNSHLVFVADNPDLAGDFYALSDDLVKNYVPDPYSVSKLYLGQTCGPGAVCKERLIDSISLAGTLLVNYIGHARQTAWAGENVFDLATINQLTNADRLPVMLPMTCLEGYYIWPHAGTASLGESVVRASGKGAVASWSPTGYGVAFGHDPLNKGFLRALLFDGIREMGPATYAGKLRLYGTGYSLEQIQEYTVFGDPALRIHSLDVADLRVDKSIDASSGLAPGRAVTFTLTFTNAGPDAAAGVVLTDLIPSQLINPTVVSATPVVISQKSGSTIAWTIADLPPHSGGEIRIRAVVNPEVEPPVSFFNTAEIGSITPDLVPDNNRARIGVNVQNVYLPLILRSQK